ncbi:hypothetical protein HN51_056748 [Arachis hypogaea]|uniref:Serine/threonine-protein kinase n=1 Tax=Arachis hypogaea TaxID=3818 RepID=A0A6B9VE25_ARAHY|nr:LEAF RUST 10 DISEASE-RESISTANCE LOCUS RECEPTOR-LIKE PROTEIN KINASE-like 1.1 [Arachis ipaensis]XP_025680039.1 LEAF RUST 10 DISEASE-RESISTANCE LOCUS RECEPTOR-LIKE PROTEIN KINASE-like 1.1 [Arachis hypogaea]QHN79683.1 Putative serine/threonine-protein kinase [Arachis hypogaea]
MAPPFTLISSLVILCKYVVLVMAQEDKCPPSFKCGELGTIGFPLTTTQHPHCGVLPIHGCKDPNANKTIQLTHLPTTSRFVVKSVNHNNATIIVRDETLRDYLRSKSCKTFSNNYSLALSLSSPLGSVRIVNNVTLFRCNHSVNVSVTIPHNIYNYTECNEYSVYYGPPIGNPQGFSAGPLAACSKIQLALKDNSDTSDPFSFLSDNILIHVLLSDDCTKCIAHTRGHCQLDIHGKFFCLRLRDRNLPWKLALGIGLPGFIIIVLLLFIWLRKPKSGPDFHSNPQEAETESDKVYFAVPVFSYKDLQVATKYFDNSGLIGDGGFGTVYYGKLRDGREVAIKRLYEHNYRRAEQFMNEVQILTLVRHTNLVSLYGCTSRHSRELLLVYEYVSNGTLACHIHGESAKRSFLPWSTRIKIAIETATALVYLHASDIIHRDVKTNNILLDKCYSVKVADFGLSRLFPNDVTHVSTAPQGTPGYVDPEYHRCYQLTSKSDVYSFGVVLVELISSKPAVDMNRDKDEINLSDLAINKIQNCALSELVDLSLGFDSDIEIKDKIAWVAELAFQCLQRDRELRPSMEKVLKMLIKIESGMGRDEHMIEEVDVHPPPSSPSSPDLDENEIEVFETMVLPPSPKVLTHTLKEN